MKKQPVSTTTSLSPEHVVALLNQEKNPLATRIEVPQGIALSQNELALNDAAKPLKKDELINTYQSALAALNLTSSSNSDGQLAGQQTIETTSHGDELTFGAPQLDLALPSGTLAANALHEFNPKHWRDQKTTLLGALALIQRYNQRKAGDLNKAVFCFLTEDQTQLIDWLNNADLAALNINQQNLILITAKQSDDLLWAIEETMHLNPNARIVAHFNLLDQTAAQRLNILAQESKSTCLLICNHKTGANSLAHSSWVVEQLNEDETCPSLTLHPNKQEMSLAWQLTWQAEEGRFRAKPKPTPAGATLH